MSYVHPQLRLHLNLIFQLINDVAIAQKNLQEFELKFSKLEEQNEKNDKHLKNVIDSKSKELDSLKMEFSKMKSENASISDAFRKMKEALRYERVLYLLTLV